MWNAFDKSTATVCSINVITVLLQRNVRLPSALDTAGRKMCGDSGNRLRASRHVLATAALANIFSPRTLEVGVADGYAPNAVKVVTEPKYRQACF